MGSRACRVDIVPPYVATRLRCDRAVAEQSRTPVAHHEHLGTGQKFISLCGDRCRDGGTTIIHTSRAICEEGQRFAAFERRASRWHNTRTHRHHTHTHRQDTHTQTTSHIYTDTHAHTLTHTGGYSSKLDPPYKSSAYAWRRSRPRGACLKVL